MLAGQPGSDRQRDRVGCGSFRLGEMTGDPHRLEHRRRTRKRRPATQRVRALNDAPGSRAQEDIVDIGLASGGETDRELAGALDADVGVRALRAAIGQTPR